MHFCFDPKKTMQAVGVLLRREETRQLPSLRLLKLLYIADRESIKETGRPITGDAAVAMQHGPVPESTYKLIRGEHYHTPSWSRRFQTIGSRIRLAEEVGVSALSEYEVEKLNEVEDRYAAMSEFDIVDETHKFEEWKKNWHGHGCSPMSARDILEAVGLGQDAEQIERDQKDKLAFDRIFKGLSPSWKLGLLSSSAI